MQHTLGWSNTRITVLEYCQKKYFFNYYTHILKDIDEKMRLDGLLLKSLKSMEMWMGEKTHHILSDYLKLLQKGDIKDDTVQNLKDEMRETMTKEFEISKNKDYEIYDRDNRFGLSEHYYGEDVDDRLDEVIDKVTNNLDAFIASEWNEKVQRYFEVAKSVFVESPKIPNYDNMKVNLRHVPELANVSILASPDFGVIFDDKNYLILDWKSGKQAFDSE
ncbi:PD-(D/E)XK nuclease family protein [Patescibacteria group bacterium]|nr:PD-(D/E)XK nuclease family protein [Patescibacteria group bacterium]MBU1758911.1 PD-(D/E)XK nuclease family protein [Patescibacteria group bacterium]